MSIIWHESGRVSAHLMDQAIRDWEDRVIAAKAMFKILAGHNVNVPSAAMGGPLRHHEDIRRFVFRKTADLNSSVGIERFQVSEEQRLAGREAVTNTLGESERPYDPDKENLLENIDNGILPDLISWGRDSRRVFTLDKETTKVFGNLTYDEFKWDDALMVMPFSSFMIEFPDPAFIMMSPIHAGRTFSPEDPIEEGMFTLSGLLVSNPAAVDPSFPNDAFCIRAFLTDIGRNEPYSVKPFMTGEMRKLVRAATKGDKTAYIRYMHQAEDYRQFTGEPKKATGLPFKVSKSENIIAADLADDGTNLVRKIVAGLCLYLAHAPGEIIGERDIRGVSREQSKKVSVSGASSNAIRDVQSVFEIRNIHEFDPKTGYVRFTDPSGRTVSAHARRAHMRREAHTPLEAPKTIKVRATWVNRIGRSMLPGGTATIVR